MVRAGPRFELLAVNKMGDPSLVTPAIADGMIFVRTQHHLFGIGRRAPAKGDARLVRPRQTDRLLAPSVGHGAVAPPALPSP
jgi:hypothetical protein